MFLGSSSSLLFLMYVGLNNVIIIYSEEESLKMTFRN